MITVTFSKLWPKPHILFEVGDERALKVCLNNPYSVPVDHYTQTILGGSQTKLPSRRLICAIADELHPEL